MTYEEVIEVEAVKERFMGNHKMFAMYLYQFADGALVGSLDRALREGNVEEAFDIAHDLKGVILNLSLKPLENPVRVVVETLRSGKLPSGDEWKIFMDAYAVTTDLIRKMKEEGAVLF